MKKTIKYICFVFAVLCCVFVPILVVSLSSNIVQAKSSDYQIARNNTAVRILAKNLSECFANAQQTVDLSSHNTTSYNSTTFWKDTNYKVSYPNVISGKTGAETSSNCAKLITGWKSNWIVKLLTSNGDFVGVKQNLDLPGDFNSFDAMWNSIETLKKYLKGVGYTESDQAIAALNGYRCVYFHMTGNNAAFDNAYPEYKPYNGNMNFISNETYCVPMRENNSILDQNKKFEVYANDGQELPSSLNRDGSNRNSIGLSNMKMNDFQISKKPIHVEGTAFAKDEFFFLVTIPSILPRWQTQNSVGDIIEPGAGQEMEIDNSVDPNICPYPVKTYWGAKYCSLTPGKYDKSSIAISYDDFKNKFTAYVSGLAVKSGYSNNGPYKLFSSVQLKEIDPDKATANYTKGDESSFVNYFFEQNGRDIVKGGYKLTKAEQYMFYYDHLKNYFGKDANTFLYDTDEGLSDYVKVNWLDEGKNGFSEKYIAISSSKTACALSNDTWPGHSCGSNMKDWKYFAQQLATFSADELPTIFSNIKPLDDDYSQDIDQPDNYDNEGAGPTCMNSAAAGEGGFIVCPVGKAMGHALSGIYSKYLEPLLMVNSESYFLSNQGKIQGSPTYSAWEAFRDIANVFFVILFLVIVFSQLTGVGIDNYGIKKTLPKLIIVAVLVNLSYIICVLCVDASNIVGSGIRDLFSNISQNIEYKVKYEGESLYAKADEFDDDAAYDESGSLDASKAGKTVGLVAIIILVGLIALFVDGVMQDPSTLIPLLLAALGALIGIIFLFVMLAARQAAIICLTVVSPVVFVLYTLPNTKKYFDKIRDIFWKLLVVYPICGLLVGAGDFASRLLLSAKNGDNANFFEILVAVAAGIAPIFFIPSVLTSALNALGGLGSRIQGLGNKLASGAKSMAGNSRFAEDARKAGSERKARLAQDRQFRRSAIRTGHWTDRNGVDHDFRNARGPIGSLYRARDRAAGSGFGRAIGWDRALGQASEKNSQIYAERDKNRASFNEMGIIMQAETNKSKNAQSERVGTARAGVRRLEEHVAQSKQDEKNQETRALNEHGYHGKNWAVASAERQNANNAADSRNANPDAIKGRHVLDAEQREKNNQIDAINQEGKTEKSVDSFRQDQRNANHATQALNEVIEEKGIHARSVDANKVEQYQKVHDVTAENDVVVDLQRDGYTPEMLAKSEDALKVEHYNQADSIIGTNNDVELRNRQGIDAKHQAKSVEAATVEKLSQSADTIGGNRAISNEIRQNEADGRSFEESLVHVAKGLNAGQLDRQEQLNAIQGRNDAITRELRGGREIGDLAKSKDVSVVENIGQFNATNARNDVISEKLRANGGNYDALAKSVKANKVEQYGQVNAIVGGNEAVETLEFMGHNLEQQAKSADVIHKERLNTGGKIVATNRSGGPALINIDNETQRLQNQQTETRATEDAGVAVTSYDTALQNAINQRTKTQAAQDAGVAAITYDNELQRAQNQRIETQAAEGVGVVSVTPELARQRAESRVNAQELKNAQDMYSGMNRNEIQARVADIPSLLQSSERGSTQQAIALLQAAQANGLENDVYDAMEFIPVDAVDPSFKSALTGAKDKVTQAWAKSAPVGTDASGNPIYMSYPEFMMSDAGMKHYIDEKGASIIPSLDDKALAQIEKYSTPLKPIMSTDLLVEAASQMTSQDALNIVDRMLASRSDISISGKQLTGLNEHTVNELLKGNGRAALDTAFNAVRGDAQLMSQLDPHVRERLQNEFGAQNAANSNPGGQP